MLSALAFVALITVSAPRDASAVYQFRKHNPCPVTGKIGGACKGWQVDHIKPLCAGGADRPDNMRWMNVAEHAEKTRADRAACAARPRPEKPAETTSDKH